MKFQPKLAALSLPILATLSCGDSEQAQTAPKPAETQSPSPSATHTQQQPTGAGILSGELMSEKARITQLPSDPFFVEYNYPGSKVYDVQLVLGARQVFLETTDSFETVDAFYAKKFTDEDGKVNGLSGRYFESAKDGSYKRAKFDRREGGGCLIVISY